MNGSGQAGQGEGARKMRRRLVDESVRLLRVEGRGSVQARRLAAEMGTSTKAVYYYAGSIPQLLLLTAEEGYRLLDRELVASPESDDPVVDLVLLALAYRRFAVRNPALYELMYGAQTPMAIKRSARTPTQPTVVELTFLRLLAKVERAAQARRIRTREVDLAAVEMWVVMHGYITLELSGAMDAERDLGAVFLPLGVDFFVGLGDRRGSARESIERALEIAGGAVEPADETPGGGESVSR